MSPNRRRLFAALALLAACGCAAAATDGRAADFDALYQRLDDSELLTLGVADVEQRLRELDALVPADDPVRTLRAQAMRCNWGFSKDPKAQLAYAEAGLQRARAAGDVDTQVRFLYCHGGAREEIDTPLNAKADYDAGIALARRIENDRLVADGLVASGGMQSLLGQQGHAIRDFLVAQTLYERAGRSDDAESNLLNLAIAYRRLGDLERALDYFRQSAAFAERIGDWGGLGSTLMQEGYLYEDSGRAPQALPLYQRALELSRRQADAYGVASAHLAMAYPAILGHDEAGALASLDRAEAEFRAIGDRSNQQMVDLRRGQALAGLGAHAQALALYARAAAAIEHGGNLRYQAMLYRARADSEQALGQSDAALADLKRYIATDAAIDTSNRSQQAEVLRFQFDSARSDAENRRLLAEKAMRERQFTALLAARRWQWTAIALGSLLVALLAALVMRQFARARNLSVLASTDPLTGVANRRRIERFGVQAVTLARSRHQPLTVLTFDIDHFKQVNDAHGHLVGDRVLIRLAHACQAALRHGDLLGRTGGEEFLVVLPDTRLAQALPIAQRLRAASSGLDLSDIPGQAPVTISLGLAELRPADADLVDLLARADGALYRAKSGGRDRIEVDV
ncbi:MAG TPA: tetratricopeptide repeat-containing diguanylate cyclase [Luteimonas sp.]|nr:tetratricopeptide repeat-containing diguanylate cyclase [Luteimonas sp.]